ncbi:hypothetical protein [Rhizobium sp. BK376]|jgi:hypothetical protein|uniref:hypothetical protein n=1 Tax=Rhizobium sp. BK376 TaxID=2512149 RepID=UPI00104F31B8|nr:hypothetical protein [Rhizobium sp. BK376]TCR91001.1 hypothetical protein EV561_103398 [Rhizobium sp. BK376]
MLPEKHDIATTEHDLKWEIEAVLAYHDEDAKAAVATLLADVHHLRMQLAIATNTMSPGFTRGWQPSPDKNEARARDQSNAV